MIIDEKLYLEHYGVKGMKWGIRKSRKETGIKRKEGAAIDRNTRRKKRIIGARSGENDRVKAALVRAFIGEEKQKANWNTLIKNLDAQSARVLAGKTTTADKIDLALNVSLLERYVSVT